MPTEAKSLSCQVQILEVIPPANSIEKENSFLDHILAKLRLEKNIFRAAFK